MPIPHAEQPTGRHWLIEALDTQHLRITKVCHSVDQPRRRGTEHHTPRRSDGLHPLCHSDLFADRGIARPSGADLTGDDLSGVETYPKLKSHNVALLDLIG